MSPLCPTKPLIAGSWRSLLSTGGICGHYKVTLRFGWKTKRPTRNFCISCSSVYPGRSHTMQVNVQSPLISHLCTWSLCFCLDYRERGESLTSGRLAVRPPWWWAPVVALGNRRQGEGPTGAGPAGNVSSLPSRMEMQASEHGQKLTKRFYHILK